MSRFRKGWDDINNAREAGDRYNRRILDQNHHPVASPNSSHSDRWTPTEIQQPQGKEAKAQGYNP
jgi:hypothetical protein